MHVPASNRFDCERTPWGEHLSRIGRLGIAFWILAAPQVAGAGPIEWRGTLELQFGTLGSLVSATTGVASVETTGGLHIQTLSMAGGFPAATTIPLTDPLNANLVTLIASRSLASGTLRPISGGGPLTSNQMPVPGTVRFCFLAVGCFSPLEIPLTVSGTVGAGLGGVITANGFGKGTHLSILGAPWTVGTAVLTGIATENDMIPAESRAQQSLTFAGFAHGPASASSTAQANGVLQLVSASRIETNLSGVLGRLPLIATLNLYFTTPEPGTALLFGSGIAVLAALGRRRSKP